MCDLCIARARDLYDFLRLRPERDPRQETPEDGASPRLSRATKRRLRQGAARRRIEEASCQISR